jgi:hypothetical protein
MIPIVLVMLSVCMFIKQTPNDATRYLGEDEVGEMICVDFTANAKEDTDWMPIKKHSTKTCSKNCT